MDPPIKQRKGPGGVFTNRQKIRKRRRSNKERCHIKASHTTNAFLLLLLLQFVFPPRSPRRRLSPRRAVCIELHRHLKPPPLLPFIQWKRCTRCFCITGSGGGGDGEGPRWLTVRRTAARPPLRHRYPRRRRPVVIISRFPRGPLRNTQRGRRRHRRHLSHHLPIDQLLLRRNERQINRMTHCGQLDIQQDEKRRFDGGHPRRSTSAAKCEQ